jgi:uracil phosphoribosyltransferase
MTRIEIDHPLVRHHMSILRDKRTKPAEFRNQIRIIATFIGIEATRDLKLQAIELETPVAPFSGHQLAERVALVPILRAGLGLVEPILQIMPDVEVWHIGIYRDEKTAMPVEYYSKLPNENPPDVCFVLDPMLATGGSIRATIAALQRWGVPDIRVLSVIASQDGIGTIQREFPDVRVFVAAVDPTLNSLKYIVPGLGDAGDRMFST